MMMIKEQQKNPLIFQTILIENKVIQLQQRKQRLVKQLDDVKDIQRKYRQKQIPIQSSYTCFNGSFVKKSIKQLYPSLEKTYGRVNQEKNEVNSEIIKELRKIVKMIKSQLVGKSQLDARVFALLNDYETNFQDQLIDSSDEEK